MTDKEPEVKELEESEEATFAVVDPDEYQRTKHLQAINEAKEAVREMRKEKPLRTTSDKWDAFHARAAERVSDYGREMWTLIKKGKEKGVLEESDLEAGDIDIQEFILTDGRVQEEGGYRKGKEPEYMAVYTELTIIQDKLGLGLELEEDKGPAEI
jgi:hypothetical protein